MVSPFTIKKCSSNLLTDSIKKKKKHLFIINFRGVPKVDDNFVETELQKLHEGLNKILHSDQHIKNVSLEKLYRTVENLHQLSQRESLLSTLKSIIEEFLKTKLEDILLANGSIFIEHLISVWTNYYKKIITIKNIYLCYDRSAKNSLKFNTVQNMCKDMFKTTVLLNSAVFKRISGELLSEISSHRNDLEISQGYLKTVLSILIDLDVYKEMFEDDFLKDSKLFFENEGNNLLNENMNIKTYLVLVNKHIKEEKSRAYVLKETTQKVLHILYEEMVANHLRQILNKGFDMLMDEDTSEDLSLLYKLCNKVPSGIKMLAEYFQDYVSYHCTAIVNKSSNEKSMIQELIEFKDRLDKVIKIYFKRNDLFNHIVKNTFTKILNSKHNEPAQFLAKYVDTKLRCKYISEDELETVLKKVMVIFRYIQGKDIFEAFYRKDLAKRLIFGKSTNQDEECSIISKLKAECGEGFTAKMEGMFKDIDVSRDINNTFRQYLTNVYPNVGTSDISISVLTSSFWSNNSTNNEVSLPDELIHFQAIFQKFYSGSHSGRKLFWQPNLGHCVLRAFFGGTPKELQVSLFQTIVLLLFNESDQLSATEIQELTKLELKELKITLHSLSCSKSKILLKEPQDTSVNMDDTFYFNKHFSDKLFRIKINQVQMKETVEELKATEKSVMVDRQFQIDAAVVRILKKKKIINHNELLTQLLNSLDIPVKPQDLKKRIELLIDREYLKRDCSNPATYTYIA